MPSPADLRRSIELAARALAVVLIAWLFWQALRPAPSSAVRTGGSRDLPASLPRWSGAPRLDTLRLGLDRAPDAVSRDWLHAMRLAGTTIRWSGPGIEPLAIAAEPVPAPSRPVRISIAGATGPIAIEDEGGLIDTLTAQGPGASLWTPILVGTARGIAERERAVARAPDSLAIRALLVVGRAGWETKFAIAALEEAGWTVEARIAVAPGAIVRRGAPARLDTARHAAVLALDASAATMATEIARYVRSGGGLVLAGDAARPAAMSTLAAGSVGARRRIAVPEADGSAPVPVHPVARLHDRALPLERAGERGTIVAAARRIEAGRVVQAGYDESWRWRMAGGEHGPSRHRAWWSGLVAQVAYAPAVARLTPNADPAPFPALLDALGPMSPAGSGEAAGTGGPPAWLLGALAIVLLAAEWGSRRLRGAR